MYIVTNCGRGAWIEVRIIAPLPACIPGMLLVVSLAGFHCTALITQ